MLQMITLNMYHTASQGSKVPKYLKKFTQFLLCCSSYCTRAKVKANEQTSNTRDVETYDTKLSEIEDDVVSKKPIQQYSLAMTHGHGAGILHEITKITNAIANKTQEDELKEEWRIVAEVLDNFAFVLFIVIHICTILVAFVFVSFY